MLVIVVVVEWNKIQLSRSAQSVMILQIKWANPLAISVHLLPLSRAILILWSEEGDG